MASDTAVVPNTTLQEVRHRLGLSQDGMARAVREAGDWLGMPNNCTKRVYQLWESGHVKRPRRAYAIALENVTGRPLASLGFDTAAERYGVDTDEVMSVGTGPWTPVPDPNVEPGPLSGIWLSSYEYPSSGRGGTYTGRHYATLTQLGSTVTVRSTDGSYSRLKMDLTLNGQVYTGVWAERTNPEGYYKGATYYGAVQMLGDPSGRRIGGKWLGFGRDGDVNTGPWRLELVTRPATEKAITEYSRIPESE